MKNMRIYGLIALCLLVSSIAIAGINTDNLSVSGTIDASTAPSVASAGTVEIGFVSGNTVHITGTTTITSFGAARQDGVERTIIFDGALTLTNSADLILPAGEDITTTAGDIAVFVADDFDTWRCVSYTTAVPAFNTYKLNALEVTANTATLDVDYSLVHLNKAASALAVTRSEVPDPGQWLTIVQTDAGTNSHVVTFNTGLIDGAYNTATFNAQYESLTLYGVASGRAVTVLNYNSVSMGP